MGYIDFGKELIEIKNHTAALFTVINKMTKELEKLSNSFNEMTERLNAINEKIDQQNAYFQYSTVEMDVNYQQTKKVRSHAMNTRSITQKKTKIIPTAW